MTAAARLLDAAPVLEPAGLLDDALRALPRARDVVGARLLAAAYREDLGAIRTTAPRAPGIRLATGGYTTIRHGFDRVAVATTVTAEPADLLDALGVGCRQLADELDDAIANLAVAYARRARIDATWRASAAQRGATDAYGLLLGVPGDAQAIAFEQLTTDGHNLHPCGRTRLGWTVADVLAHDQESPATRIGFVAIHLGAHVGEDIGALLRDGYPAIPVPPDGYVLQPVHPWQLTNVLRTRYADLFRRGVLAEVPGGTIGATPTTALRTVLLAPDRHGVRRYLKLSLDIQVTSTRRSISVASTRNGPAISAILAGLVTDPTVLLMAEVAGAAMTGTEHGEAAPGVGSRDLAVIVRTGLGDRVGDGEVAVPGAALPATSPVSGRPILVEIVDRYAATRAITDRPTAALAFVEAYASLLLPPVLRLLDAGVGLEAHLQNSIPVFRDGVPVRIALRDFAGLRLHLPRLRARGLDRPLWPGSVIGTDDVGVVRAKVGYTAFQAHLGEIVTVLHDATGLDEREAWRRVRAVVDAVYASDPALAREDHAFLVAPTMPHKALVRMRISSASGHHGDIYLPVRNPLHDH